MLRRHRAGCTIVRPRLRRHSRSNLQGYLRRDDGRQTSRPHGDQHGYIREDGHGVEDGGEPLGYGEVERILSRKGRVWRQRIWGYGAIAMQDARARSIEDTPKLVIGS